LAEFVLLERLSTKFSLQKSSLIIQIKLRDLGDDRTMMYFYNGARALSLGVLGVLSRLKAFLLIDNFNSFGCNTDAAGLAWLHFKEIDVSNRT